MPSRRIDRFLDEARRDFSRWRKVDPWRGKEHDCVDLFAHKFLFEKIEPGAAVECLAQIRIECALKQPANYINLSARKDLVVWKDPLENTWSHDWKPVRSPRTVMEWKVYYRTRMPKRIFDLHDEEWIAAYPREHPTCLALAI